MGKPFHVAKAPHLIMFSKYVAVKNLYECYNTGEQVAQVEENPPELGDGHLHCPTAIGSSRVMGYSWFLSFMSLCFLWHFLDHYLQ